MFAVTSTGTLRVWDQLEIVVVQWRNMEEAAKERGPYIYAVTRTGLSKIDLTA